MYFTSLPDHSRAGFDERLHFSRFGKTNIVFNATSDAAGCDDHVGCLSIKTVLSGEEWYRLDGRNVAVRPGQFLVLNDGQAYSCRIISGPVKTVSVFFGREFSQAVLHDSTSSEEKLLDNPSTTGVDAPEFLQTLRGLEGEINEDLSKLIRSLESEGYESDRVDEHLVFLLGNFIRIHRKDLAASKNILGIKSSTQKEIYKRVCIARDLLHTYYGERPDLQSISAASCLSVPQLLRQFKAAFGTTPHRYLTAIRLQRAAKLLQSTTMHVADIALSCGFENTSAFGRAFKGEFGIPALKMRIRLPESPSGDSG